MRRRVMAKATEEVLERTGWQTSDSIWSIPHQANIRIIESAAKRLGMPLDKFYVNLDRYGNTSSASIPIALCEAIAAGRVRSGDKLVLVGFGAGLTWSAAAISWGIPMPIRTRSAGRRLLANVRFSYATFRSLGLRGGRRAYDAALGPEGRNDVRGRVRQRIDQLRGADKSDLED